ncbi:putative chloride channel, voltage gated, chloride channel, core [Helianthus anomalus]
MNTFLIRLILLLSRLSISIPYGVRLASWALNQLHQAQIWWNFSGLGSGNKWRSKAHQPGGYPIMRFGSYIKRAEENSIAGLKRATLRDNFFDKCISYCSISYWLTAKGRLPDDQACAAVLYAYIAPQLVPVGIPEVKAYLNGVDAHSILAPSTLFVKIFGSIFGVAAGFVVGKEGPMVHTGAWSYR